MVKIGDSYVTECVVDLVLKDGSFMGQPAAGIECAFVPWHDALPVLAALLAEPDGYDVLTDALIDAVNDWRGRDDPDAERVAGWVARLREVT